LSKGTLSPERQPPPNNQLLVSLPPEVANILQSRLEAVDLAAGTTLHEAGTVLGHVYFPITAIVSLVSPLQDGACAEVAVVGREGVVGVCAFMGGGKALSSAVVQRSGSAWRMRARDIADLAREFAPAMQQLLRYTQALFTHMAQTSACHRHHALPQQLCRWLLQHLDRQVGEEIRITQERIAGFLGVRREGVTAAALQLQREGLIRYGRGHIRVLDRRGLEQHSCECYGVVERAYEQLRNCSQAWPHPSGAAERSNEVSRLSEDVSGEAARAPLSVWNRVRILVVDDDACNQIVAEALLNALGYYNVAIANNGVEALAACRVAPPELVLMDIEMPLMGGLEATAGLRALQRLGTLSHFPIVAATSGSDRFPTSVCLGAGLDGYLTKPLDLQVLEEELRRVLPAGLVSLRNPLPKAGVQFGDVDGHGDGIAYAGREAGREVLGRTDAGTA
jgi:CheY-like chemotaxis protein